MPTLGQAVEVLEDVAVAAADPGVLGHVDDAQHAVGIAHGTRVEERSPALPEGFLGRSLACAHIGPSRNRLPVDQRRRGVVEDAVAGLPRSQAPVDVLIRHREAVVERADGVHHFAADVHACTGDRERRQRDVRWAVRPALKRKR